MGAFEAFIAGSTQKEGRVTISNDFKLSQAWHNPATSARTWDRLILEARGPKNQVRSDRPFAYFNEPEHSASGKVEDVTTLFLVNQECPFHCLMCDLWKNTLDKRIEPGLIPKQIAYALAKLPAAPHIKLYNSANFFDRNAIPNEDHQQIIKLVGDKQTVIVENHPRVIPREVWTFQDQLAGQLEIAMGLESIHPEVVARLNKRMTLTDFARACETLKARDVQLRSFILLRPPGLDEQAGIEWALRSLEFAFDHGVGCCTIIPTRAGNGLMEQLADADLFAPPRLTSLEQVLELSLNWKRGRVFVDLWDAEQLTSCEQCKTARIERLQEMNLTQTILPAVECHCEP